MELEKLLLNITATQNKEKLKEFLEVTYPIDIAAAITKFGRNELSLFLNLLSAEEIATILEESEEDLQQNIIRLLDSEMIVTIFAYMSSDDIADILGILGINQRKELLKKMKESDSIEIQMLLGYGPETAGGIMTTQYIALRNNLSVKEALHKIKVIGPKTEVIEILFIINESNELIGSADLRDVLVAKNETTLEEIMDENVLHVFPETDQEEVSLIVSKYDLKALPVVNRNKSILGIVTVGLFEDVIVQVVALAAAMPIVAGMGGNAGSQTLSIVIRSIALGEVDIKEDWKVVFKEITLGLINGLATGLVTGLILFIRYDNLYLGLIILAAMIGNLMIAGFFGFIIPLILKKFKLDPAISSSIFLTTATDVFGFFLFLGLAKMFLPLLL